MAQNSRPLIFTVPFPPSVNCLYRNNSGRGRRPKSEQYQEWIRRAYPFIFSAKDEVDGFSTITTSVAAWYRHGEFEDKVVRDAENYSKAISDLLKSEKILEDDSLIRLAIGEWASDVDRGYTQVIIAPLNDIQVTLKMADW